MAWFKRSSRFTTLTLALTLGFVLNVPTLVQAQLTPSLSSKLENAFRPPKPPGEQTPVNRTGGGTRGPCMTKESKPLIALVPSPENKGEIGVGVTAAEHPTVYWYMPQISAENAPAPAVEFVLKDANDQVVYLTQYALEKSAEGVVGAPGIMKLTVDPYSLDMGKEYYWQLALMCDSQGPDRSQDIVIEGRIKRVEPNLSLQTRSQQAISEDLVAMYADQKLWYETVNALAELRRDRPNDLYLKNAWKTLLSTVGLGEISDEPLF